MTAPSCRVGHCLTVGRVLLPDRNLINQLNDALIDAGFQASAVGRVGQRHSRALSPSSIGLWCGAADGDGRVTAGRLVTPPLTRRNDLSERLDTAR